MTKNEKRIFAFEHQINWDQVPDGTMVSISKENVMKLKANIASLRAEVTRLKAENERMRGALTEIQQETFDWPLSPRKEEPFIQLFGRLNHIAKDALSPSTNESTKPKKIMTQEELDLLHANLE